MNVFFEILSSSMTLTLIYFAYKSIVSKLITLQISLFRVINHLSLHFIKYSPYHKIIEIKILDLDVICIFYNAPILFYDELLNITDIWFELNVK
jgi:hypothetical protein